ncbi:hypothetical protein KM043_015851 [Ampulex compressa]|nr:hypothetical protein KM043_015851 [Ampulex compressa]
MGVSSGTARCVGGGSEEKRRRAPTTVTWHRCGLLFSPDLSVFPQVLCRACVRFFYEYDPEQEGEEEGAGWETSKFPRGNFGQGSSFERVSPVGRPRLLELSKDFL